MTLTPLAQLRRLINEPDAAGTYSDVELTDRLTAAANDMNTVARDVWAEKVAAYADLVNISEGGSSRSMSQAYDHAKEMWKHYYDLVLLEAGNAAPVLRRITRV